MNFLLTALLFATTAQWDFVGEVAAPHHIHLLHDGIDLGRTAAGTVYDGSHMVVVLDNIAKRGFE